MKSTTLVTLALAFWAWKTGFLIPGAFLIALYELPRLHGFRIQVSYREWNRAANVFYLAVVAAAIFPLFSRDGAYDFLSAFRSINFVSLGVPSDLHSGRFLVFSLPALAFAFAWMARYSNENRIPVRIFRAVFIGTWRNDPNILNKRVEVEPIYFAILLLSASATDGARVQYLIGMVVLLGLFIFRYNPARHSRKALIWALVGTTGLSFGGYYGLIELQRYVEGEFIQFAAKYAYGANQNRGARVARTAIGQLGKLKQSGQIIMRIRSESDPPKLLKLQTYQLFRGTEWSQIKPSAIDRTIADRDPWISVAGEDDLETWNLRIASQELNLASIEIEQGLKPNNGTLPLPFSVTSLEKLPVGEVRTNLFGAAQAIDGPGLVKYIANYEPNGPSFDPAPFSLGGNQPDLSIETERKNIRRYWFLQEWVESRNLRRLPVSERVRTIQDFFATENFEYTTHLDFRPAAGEDPIVAFLSAYRKGHCEYFATATVLLLRAAGIPARYVMGYAVTERKDDLWIVRKRHCHTWAIYWDGQRWRPCDTTPSSWREKDKDDRSIFEPIQDRLSAVTIVLRRIYWSWARFADEQSFLLGALLVVLVAFLFYRIVSQRRVQGVEPMAANRMSQFGLDSEFFRLLPALGKTYGPRRPYETVFDWLHRLSIDQLAIKEVATLHNQYRFDPSGIPPSSRERLQELCERILAETKELRKSQNPQ